MKLYNTIEVQKLVEKYQDVLNVKHWRVVVLLQTKKEMGKSLMRITPTRKRNYALLEVRSDLTVEELRPLILHELLHLVIDPIVEEHYWQKQEHTAQEWKVGHSRFEIEVERTTEHLALVIANLTK